MNIGIIVLNYLAYQETINCVNSFLNQNYHDNRYYIVIVDNASSNESYKVLTEQYEYNEKVCVIRANRNLGFANGNNLGYEEIRKAFTPDYLIVSNDDILLKQQGLVDWIVECDKKFKFSVLGPCIYSSSGNFYQSPMKNYPTDFKQFNTVYRRIQLNLYKASIRKLIRKPMRNSTVGKSEIANNNKMSTEYTLHGSFQVFAKKYFEYYHEPYDPRTFLYLEEYILRLRCLKKGLLMVYSPDYEVTHLQAVSSKLSIQNDYDRLISRQKHLLNSAKVYKAILVGEQSDGDVRKKKKNM